MTGTLDLTEAEAARVEAAVRREREQHIEAERRGERIPKFDEGNARGRALEAVALTRQQRAAAVVATNERERQGAEVRAAWESLVRGLHRHAKLLRADDGIRRFVKPEHIVVADVGPMAESWASIAMTGSRPTYSVREGLLPDERAEGYPFLVILEPRLPGTGTSGECFIETRLPDRKVLHLLDLVGVSRAGGRPPGHNGALIEAFERCEFGMCRPGAALDRRCSIRTGVNARGEPILGTGGYVVARDAWMCFIPNS